MFGILKNVAKKIPFVAATNRAILNHTQTTENVFTSIYRNNSWNGADSVSGVGSDTEQTQLISQELPKLFREFNITSILDIPCGDFHWMKNVHRGGVDYLGADIVADLVATNSKRYATQGVRFEKLNLIKDALPKVDLIFCRDCLVHLPNAPVIAAIANICESESTYLLATTFTRNSPNIDIATGKWRPLNLEIFPFNLPPPVQLINEGYTDSNGAFADKSLGLYRISDIRRDQRFSRGH